MVSNLNLILAREIAEDRARNARGRHTTQERDDLPTVVPGTQRRLVRASLLVARRLDRRPQRRSV